MADANPATPAGWRRLEFAVVLSIVGFVVMLAALSIFAGLDEVLANVRRIDARLVAVLLGLSLFNYALRAWRWQYFGNGLGIHVRWDRNLLYFMAGFSMTTTPGKAGEALRVWFLERCHGYAIERATPMFLGDRLNDSLAILLLCIISVGAFSGYEVLTAIAAAGFGLFMLMFMRPRFMLWATNLLFGLSGRRFPRLFAKLRTAIRDTARLMTPRLFGVGLVVAMIGWVAEAYGLQLVLQHLGVTVTLQQALFVFTFAMIAGTAAMLPGGLGGTEAVMLALLAAMQVPFEIAVTATAVVRLATLWFATALGFICLPFAMRLARRGRPGPAVGAAG